MQLTLPQRDRPVSGEAGNLIAVDFVHRRRLGVRRCCAVDIMSFSNDREGLVPRSFQMATRLVLIWDILDKWLAADYRYFKVRAVDQGVYFLRHDLNADEWSVYI